MQFTRLQGALTRRSQWHVFALAGATLGLLLAVAVGCSKQSAASPTPGAAPADAPQAHSVTTVKPQRDTVRYTIKQPGYNIEAFQQTPVYAKIAGYVAKVNFDIGDRVHKGDILAELSVPEMQVELKQ